jgi:dipeptidyl aminopeptidase/acylaminoacyl peptidase
MRLILVSLVVQFAILFTGELFAQGTQADYDRAQNLQRLTANKVFRDRVQPTWFGAGRYCWYRVETGPRSHEFVLVDAQAATRAPAFDHAKLAAALREAGVKSVDPQRLPLEALTFDLDQHTLDFRAAGSRWQFNLNEQTLAKRPADVVAKDEPQPDPPRQASSNGETWLTFINQTGGSVELFWLPGADDQARRSYAKVEAGKEHRQHTFVGHRWLVADAQGRELLTLSASDDARTIEISRDAQPKQPPRDARRPHSGPTNTSPDGQWRVTVSDHNLVLEDRRSGETFPLSTDGAPEDAYEGRIYWSPDSERLVALRTQPAQEHLVNLIESSPRDQTQPKLHSFNYLKPGDRIAVTKPKLFQVSERKQIPVSDELFATPWSIGDIRWASDSSRFTFAYNQRGHQALRILAVDAASGEVRPIVNEESATFVEYSGKHFVRYLDETDELLWMSERDGWNHLYLYDYQSGEVKNQVTRGEWVVRGVDRVDAAQRQIWFHASGIYPDQDPYYTHYCRVNFDGTGLVTMTAANGAHSIEYSPDHKYILDTWSRVDQPPVTELRRVEDGSLVCELERGDWNALLATGWQPPEPFVAKGRDGQTDIYGVIWRPTNFDETKSYPVIENIYAGPQGSFVPKGFRSYYGQQKIAELGFIVVQIDGMGTSNRSKKFHDVCWKNLGDAGFPDRILWIKAAAQKYPYLDVSRVGIYGGSAGGQNSLGALLTHGDFYKVAVSDCGCHDNRMDKIWWNELWMGWPVGKHYDEQSNVTLAPRLQGKLLLVVGELDRNVDPASTMQVANALVRADKDFDLLIIPGAGHGSAESPYGQRRRMDFFVRHLLGVEPRG